MIFAFHNPMNILSTNYFNFTFVQPESFDAAIPAARAQSTDQFAIGGSLIIGDSFSHGNNKPQIGYENLSALQKSLSNRLENLPTVNIPATGVPSAVLLKTTLEAIDEALIDGKADQLHGNPYILMDLLDMLVEKEG